MKNYEVEIQVANPDGSDPVGEVNIAYVDAVDEEDAKQQALDMFRIKIGTKRSVVKSVKES